jgi:hypothetical protein
MSHWRIDTISPADGLAFASLVNDRVREKGLRGHYEDVRDGREQTVFVCAPQFHVQPVALGATADAAEVRGFVPRLMRETTTAGLIEVEFGSIEEVVEVVRRLYNGSSCYFGPEPPTGEGATTAPWGGPPLSSGGATFERAKKYIVAIGALKPNQPAERADVRSRIASLLDHEVDEHAFEIAVTLAVCGAETMRRGLDRTAEDDGLALVDAGMQAFGAALALVRDEDRDYLMKEIDSDYGDVIQYVGLHGIAEGCYGNLKPRRGAYCWQPLGCWPRVRRAWPFRAGSFCGCGVIGREELHLTGSRKSLRCWCCPRALRNSFTKRLLHL